MRGSSTIGAVFLALLLAPCAAKPQPGLPIAALDARMEEVKATLWGAPPAAASPAQRPQRVTLYTRSEQENVALLDFAIRQGAEKLTPRLVGGSAASGPYGRHSWWLLPENAVTDAPVDFVYTLRVDTDEGAKRVDGVLRLPEVEDDVIYELVFKTSALGGTDPFLVQWRTESELNPILAFLRMLIAPLIPNAPIEEDFYRPGALGDPALRYARAQCSHGLPLSGLRVLGLHYAEFAGRLAPRTTLVLARCALRAGLRSRAQELLESWQAAPAVTLREAAAAGLDFAAADYRRGSLARARASLEAMAGKPAGADLVRWRDLLSRVLFALADNAAATALLTHFDPKLDQNWTAHDGYARRLAFMRYNLAVGSIRSGEVAAGRTLLYLLGTAAEFTPSLRDQANLSLGWSFLESGHGASARRALSRVSLGAAQSDRALLGYGWAMLADAGEPVARAPSLPGDSNYKSLSAPHLAALYQEGKLSCQAYNRLSLLPTSACPTGYVYTGTQFLRHLIPDDAKPEERAAAIWEFLTNRDGRGPATIEARLALALILAKLGDRARAAQELQTLLRRTASAQAAIGRAQAAIGNGRLIDGLLALEERNPLQQPGWGWSPSGLPELDAIGVLRQWLAQHRTVALVQLVRDARLLRAVIEGRRDPVLEVHLGANTDALHATLNAVETAAGALFRAEATQILARRSTTLASYQRAGRLALTTLMQMSAQGAANDF